MNKYLQNLVYNIAEREGYYFALFISKRRTKHLVAKRHECWGILAKEGFSSEEIAEVFGADSSTVQYGIRKFNKTLKRELKLNERPL